MNVQRGTRARKIKSQNGRTLYPEILYFKDFFPQDFLVTKFRTLFPQDFFSEKFFGGHRLAERAPYFACKQVWIQLLAWEQLKIC